MLRIILGGQGYSFITASKNVNNWNTPFAAFPPELPPPPNPISFYNKIKLGNETGIKEILDGFELNNQTLAFMSQMINCTFSDFHSHMFAQSLINFDQGA